MQNHYHLTQLLDDITTQYLMLSGHLVRLIELKVHTRQDLTEQLIHEILHIGRQVRQLISLMKSIYQNLTEDGDTGN